MKIYFSTNEKYYSKIVRWLFDEPVSHIGLGFNINGVEMVIDCAKSHGKLYHLKDWENKYSIFYHAEIETSDQVEADLFKKAVRHNIMKPFDKKAYYWFLLAGLKSKIFNTPLPEKNPVQAAYGNICTEIIKPIRKDLWELYDIDLSKYDFSCKTPFMVGEIIRDESMECPFLKWVLY